MKGWKLVSQRIDGFKKVWITNLNFSNPPQMLTLLSLQLQWRSELKDVCKLHLFKHTHTHTHTLWLRGWEWKKGSRITLTPYMKYANSTSWCLPWGRGLLPSLSLALIPPSSKKRSRGPAAGFTVPSNTHGADLDPTRSEEVRPGRTLRIPRQGLMLTR